MTSIHQSAWYRNYVLGVLFLVYCLSFIDRQIIAVLSPAIKADLALNDTELGALKGLAFALFYAGMGIPLAIIGDRGSRVRLISICLALWSAMTVASGAAHSFIHLFLARMGIGIGEAGGVAPAHSIISDYFRKDERARALGLFSLGIPAGILFGYLLGGWLATAYGWRLTFVIVGTPGLAMAFLLYLTVREPERGATDEREGVEREEQLHWLTVIRSLWKIPTYRTVVYAGSLNAFCGYALSNWLADFFVRTHDFTMRDLGAPLALVNGVGVGVGIYLGGVWADRYATKDGARYLSIPGTCFALAVPLLICAFWVSSSLVSLVLLFIAFVLSYVSIAPLFTVLQLLAPVNSRALCAAYFLLWQNLLGAGLGPFVMGGASDLLHIYFDESGALRIALTSLGLVTGIAAVVLLTKAKSARADLGIGLKTKSAEPRIAALTSGE